MDCILLYVNAAPEIGALSSSEAVHQNEIFLEVKPILTVLYIEKNPTTQK